MGAVLSAVRVKGELAEVTVALFVAVTPLVPGAAGAPLHEYVFTPDAPGVDVQFVPRAGNA